MKSNRWKVGRAWVIQHLLSAYSAAIISTLSLCIQAQVLNVPVVTQEQNQWCWVGVSASTLQYYGSNIAQCTIAEYTRVQAIWHNFGSVNCCTDPNQGCNYWNYNWGYAGSIQDILQHWGVNNYGYGSYLSLSQIQTEIGGLRPFIIRWGWVSSGGHFVVGHGISGTTMYYMDPWYGEGAKIAAYNWVISDGNHNWTHTNILTTTPSHMPQAPVNLSALLGNARVTLTWNRNTEPDFLRYRIFAGTSANPTVKIDSTTGGSADTVKTISALTNETTYYFRITAVDSAGNASSYSNEVSAKPSCCVGTRGNVNVAGIVDLSDLSLLVNYLTGGGGSLPCEQAANVNGTGIVDLSDLSALVSYLTGGGYTLPNCP